MPVELSKPMRRWGLGALAVGLSLALPACSQAAGPAAQQTEPSEMATTPSQLTEPRTERAEPAGSMAVPFATRSVGDNSTFLAAVSGVYERQDECAWLLAKEGDVVHSRYLIVFPHEHTSLDANGSVWVHETELVEGRTYQTASSLRPYSGVNPIGLVQPIPETCDADHYFFALWLDENRARNERSTD